MASRARQISNLSYTQPGEMKMFILYGDVTTNTQKVTIALAELGLDYQKIRIDRSHDEQMEGWFLKLSPNHKFPVLKDDEKDITVWESGAILVYLCDQYDKAGELLPLKGAARYETLQGAFFQAANVGPNLGRLNAQMIAEDGEKIPKMLDLFYAEAVRLTEVLDRMLDDGRPFIAGDYSIADIMHYPWLQAGIDMKFPALMEKPRLPAWLGRISDRPAVQAGMSVTF